MNEAWRIELFGGLIVRRGDIEIVRFRTHKNAALLAFLAHCRERSHRRDVLIDMLWPDHDLEAGRNCLNVALSSLRSQLEDRETPPIFVTDRASVRLDPAVCGVDTADFRAHLRRAGAAASALDKRAALRRAVELYSGRLLPGFYEEWAIGESRALEEEYFNSILRLIDDALQRGDYAEAIGLAERALTIDPQRDDVLTKLVQLLELTGRVDEARRRRDDHEMPSVDVPQSTTPSPLQFRFTPAPAAGAMPISANDTPTILLVELLGVDCSQAGELLTRSIVENGGRILIGEPVDVDTSTAVVAAAFASAADAVDAAVDGYLHLGHREPEARVRMALDTGDIADAGISVLERHARALLAAAHFGQIVCTEATAVLLRRRLLPSVVLRDVGLYRIDYEPERLFTIASRQHPAQRSLPFREGAGVGQGTDREAIPGDFPPLNAPRAADINLPGVVTRFFGRAFERETLARLLTPGEGRLVTLTGPGGVGKTRFAVEMARELVDAFLGRVYFVPLVPCVDENDVRLAILAAITRERELGRDFLDIAVEAIGEGPALLVLDNFERLVDCASTLISDLKQRCPSLTCLITSQRTLGVSQEISYPVGTLPVPRPEATFTEIAKNASVQLFLDRARAVRPDYNITAGNAEAVAGICRGLEGLPLALELAAARVNVLSPSQMLAQIENRFVLLSGGKRDRPDRHRTLQAAIDWSFDLLNADLKTALGKLSVFPGTFDLDAAVAVCDDPGVFATLWDLHQYSLIAVDETSVGTRFGMLESVRQYAAAQREHSLDSALFQRHTEYYRGLSSILSNGESTADFDRCVRLFELEQENFRLALDHAGRGNDLLEMLVCLHSFWITRGYAAEASARLHKAIDETRAADGVWIACAQSACGTVDLNVGDFASAAEMIRRSLDFMRGAGKVQAEMGLLNNLGTVYAYLDTADDAKSSFYEALSIAQRLGDVSSEALIISNVARIEEIIGDYEACRTHIEWAVPILRSTGDRLTLADALRVQGRVELNAGNLDCARELLGESLRIRREIGDRSCLPLALHDFAEAATAEDPSTAATLFFGAEAIRAKSSTPEYPGEAARRKTLLDRFESRLGAGHCASLRAAAASMTEQQLLDLPALGPLLSANHRSAAVAVS